MDIYVAHTDKMADSAVSLSEKLGANHGSISNAPNDSLVLFLGVPSEKSKSKAKTVGTLKDIRAFWKDKDKIIKKLNPKKSEGGEDLLVYVLGDQIVGILSQVKKTRKSFLYDKLGKDVVDDLIHSGDIYKPDEEVSKESKIDVYASFVQDIQSIIDTISDEYDVGIYAIKCKAKQNGDLTNTIYIENILLSPSLRREKISEKIAEKLKDMCDSLSLVDNEVFVNTLGDMNKLKEIINRASSKDISIISKMFNFVNRACVEANE